MSRVMIEKGAFVKTVPAYRLSDYEADGWMVKENAQEQANQTETEPDKGKKKSGK